jgi:hypothetical protein
MAYLIDISYFDCILDDVYHGNHEGSIREFVTKKGITNTEFTWNMNGMVKIRYQDQVLMLPPHEIPELVRDLNQSDSNNLDDVIRTILVLYMENERLKDKQEETPEIGLETETTVGILDNLDFEIENKHSKFVLHRVDLYQFLICLFDAYHECDGKGMLAVVLELLDYYYDIVDKVTYRR